MSMKILVTGGAGFIGTYLVKRLLAEGHSVTIFDNFSNSKKENAPKDVKLVEGDIRDVDDVKRVMKDIQAVFHLAAITEARSQDEDAVYTVNFIGSKNVFECAKEAGAKIIFTSSAAVYGESKISKETDDCNPLSQYGKSKLRAEKICPPNSFIVRLFNVYGPGGNSVVNKFCKAISNYKDITLFGTGMQTRDFVYVDDVVEAFLLGLNQSGVYNIGTGVETSVMQLIDLIEAITRGKSDMKFTPPIPGEILRSRADISKISTLWKPATPLKNGIELVLRNQGFDLDLINQVK